MSQWINDIFKADQAQNGGVVRRSKQDVVNNASANELLTEVKARSFHLIETGDQYVILCHTGALQIHC